MAAAGKGVKFGVKAGLRSRGGRRLLNVVAREWGVAGPQQALIEAVPGALRT